MPPVTRGFHGRRPASDRVLPPGQHDVGDDFPVLSIGPTPRTHPTRWDLQVTGGAGLPRRWSTAEFAALPHEDLTTDLHCVTTWSKFGTSWRGVSVDLLLEGVSADATHVLVGADGGYSTNLPLSEVTGGRAWVVDTYAGAPLTPEHGGPARLLVPHLYLWKSAKWVRSLELRSTDQPGFWENLGYHELGDPWREQRYSGD
ncbi:molybdopterin-dependent oxidoreductase [Rhodococcus antarcticus]|uniref:Molybdopterin-dependent oxidoreductase n=1 Tax=Rhodococcus antarcticus TaxID=2987751 RepID=A0ABY6NWM5_9NOCA|nr:molybdopterin-dependent oxidoreductase [Rhodococcus antarcticus]UZJ23800.1 molybdopterin-dependent oxidoreductase [Rhodococcus antarcticus]